MDEQVIAVTIPTGYLDPPKMSRAFVAGFAARAALDEARSQVRRGEGAVFDDDATFLAWLAAVPDSATDESIVEEQVSTACFEECVRAEPDPRSASMVESMRSSTFRKEK